MYKNMNKEDKLKYCGAFTHSICYPTEDLDAQITNPEAKFAIEKYRREEKVRRISRNYKSTKDDFTRLENG